MDDTERTPLRKWVLALIAILFLPMTANAVVIEITGQGSADGTWDVTTIYGPFGALAQTLTAQVWWGSESLASVFAYDAMQSGLQGNPYFSFALDEGGPGVTPSPVSIFCEGPCLAEARSGFDEYETFAVADRVARLPEPDTLSLLWAGLAMIGWCGSPKRQQA